MYLYSALYAVVLYHLGQDLGKYAADYGNGHGFYKSLDSHQQHHEVQRVERAFCRDDVLDVLGVIEHEYDVAHEEYRVEKRRGERSHEIAPGLLVAVQLAYELKDQAAAHAHEHTHSHAQDHRAYRVALKEERRHSSGTGDGVPKAEEPEYSSEYGACKRAHEHCSYGYRKRKEAHVERSDRYSAEAQKPHYDLDSYQQCQLGKEPGIHPFCCLFHYLIPPYYLSPKKGCCIIKNHYKKLRRNVN